LEEIWRIACRRFAAGGKLQETERWEEARMGSLNLLSSLTYFDTERSIEAGEMKIVQTEYNLHLYEDTLTAFQTHFKLANVWDMSYRSFSSEVNLLYLHTHRGVIAYKVHADPGHFVTTFKKLKNVNY
jgi:hypothetical protein